MSTIRTEYTQAELDEIDDRIVQAFALLQDVIEDPSLLEQFPRTSPHLRVTSAGRYPDSTPDFRTPHTDVYIVGQRRQGDPLSLVQPQHEQDERAG